MAVTTNPGPAPQPEPHPQPQPPPQPGQPPRPPSEPSRPTPRNEPEQRLVTVAGEPWEPPPPATPTQEELDAMATGEYDPVAPEGQRIKRRSMDPAHSEPYQTR